MDNITKIRMQNDALRAGMVRHGEVYVTGGVAAKGADFVLRARQAVASYSDFDSDNDPYREHDFGAFTLDGEHLFFKIEYYDLEGQAHSPDPADPDMTLRVLTVMLASEY